MRGRSWGRLRLPPRTSESLAHEKQQYDDCRTWRENKLRPHVQRVPGRPFRKAFPAHSFLFTTSMNSLSFRQCADAQCIVHVPFPPHGMAKPNKTIRSTRYTFWSNAVERKFWLAEKIHVDNGRHSRSWVDVTFQEGQLFARTLRSTAIAWQSNCRKYPGNIFEKLHPLFGEQTASWN